MHREKRFKVWRPKIVCACDHPLEIVHPGKGRCIASGCGCTRFEWKKRPSKWKNVRTEAFGRSWDSKFERNVYADLLYRKQCGDIADVIPKPGEVALTVNGIKIAGYRPDFKVIHNDGTVEYVESKGAWTREGLMKARLFEALFCDGKAVKYTVLRGSGWKAF